MKRIITIFAVFIMVLTVACNQLQRSDHPDEGYDESLYNENDNPQIGYVGNPVDRNPPNGRNYSKMGFSRQQGKELHNATDGGSVPGPDVYIDRNVLARQISFLTTKLPEVEDTTVVVTDDHVFIGLQGKKGSVSDKTKYEAKRTALSLTPRYYKILVTSDSKMKQRLNDIGSKLKQTGNRDLDIEGWIRQLEDGYSGGFDKS